MFEVKFETTGVVFTTIVSVNVSTLEQPFNAIKVTSICWLTWALETVIVPIPEEFKTVVAVVPLFNA